ncbi:helix-turn-helix domain-containing protein [Streptomyces puniciscabiei]|uniref:helix-turn-helix domain-containing protein n=1 Tax=Streptomyces puniciscabiei TaxID=164348 RepID=UPI00379BEF22
MGPGRDDATVLSGPRAEDYAHRLGYPVKALTRACLAAIGRPVKQVIGARVALQAQWLLTHTEEPVAVIARRLGFSEPSGLHGAGRNCRRRPAPTNERVVSGPVVPARERAWGQGRRTAACYDVLPEPGWTALMLRRPTVPAQAVEL